MNIAPGSVFTAGVQFEVLALAAITEVFDNDTPLTQRTDAAALDQAEDGWTYENATGGTLRVKLGPGAHTLVATSRHDRRASVILPPQHTCRGLGPRFRARADFAVIRSARVARYSGTSVSDVPIQAPRRRARPGPPSRAPNAPR